MSFGFGFGFPKNYVAALFSPAQLFTGSTNGVWYDPSDFSTMFQDAAGTTPVTAVGQPVGLMLDKSKGLVLGPELSSYASGFSSTAGITGIGATLSLSGTSLVATSTSTDSDRAEIPISGLVTGLRYLVTIVARRGAQGTNQSIRSSTALNIPITAVTSTSNQTFTFRVDALAASGIIRVYAVDAPGAIGDIVIVDNISVRELPGNHAYNPSGNSANFPVLSARYNLQAGSQVDSGWAGQATTPPTVTNSVSYLGESCVAVTFGPLNLPGYANSRAAYSANDVITILGQRYITSFNVSLSRDLTGGESIAVYYTGANGLATAVINAANSSSFVGQWNRITTVAVTAVAGGAVRIYAYNAQTLTSDVTVYINKADLRVSNDALNQPAYQRVNTATDYDTVGFKPYLSFNGVNQWLQTNSIDFAYGDKMFVAAGVRKLVDQIGMVAELSSSYDSISGSFGLTARSGSGNDIGWASRGTNVVPITFSVLAPVTAVVSGTGNISAPSATLRVNGSNVAQSTASQGAGNYGNYPLYIGARAGSSLWFNGRLYGLVIAGKQASAAEITNTESWLNQKTGAY